MKGRDSNLRYSKDDLNCFNNLQWEMSELNEYLKDCNQRKITYFKFSIGLITVLITLFGTVFGIYKENSKIIKEADIHWLFIAILLVVCFLNFSVTKELFSLHASRVLTYRQMNSLRRAMDSIRYKRYEGNYPENLEVMKDENTNYWKEFGRHRKLPLESSGLRKNEKNWLQSPDKLMILVLGVVTLALEGIVFYELFVSLSEVISKTSYALVGAALVAINLMMFYAVNSSRKALNDALGLH